MPSLWLQPLKKYADFTGRATRGEYWGFQLVILLVIVVGAAVEAAVRAILGSIGSALVFFALGLGYLYVVIPALAVTFRRLHDTGRSAWWLLIAIVPILGGLTILVFSLLDGTAGPNRFGEDPKGRAPAGGGSAGANPQLPAHRNEPLVS